MSGRLVKASAVELYGRAKVKGYALAVAAGWPTDEPANDHRP
jgi:hypothetical protein